MESEIENDISFAELGNVSYSNTGSPPNANATNEIKKLNKLLDIYKNKFRQLKDAYAETEAEKEKIRTVLADSQDKVLKRVSSQQMSQIFSFSN